MEGEEGKGRTGERGGKRRIISGLVDECEKKERKGRKMRERRRE